MARRNKKHKRQATRRRKKSTNNYVEKNLKRYFSRQWINEEYNDLNLDSRIGLSKFFRLRYSWNDDGRKFCCVGTRNSWKFYRKKQYRNE